MYIANQQNGMEVLDLGAFNVNIVNDKNVIIDEVQYSDGSDEEKQCLIKIKMQEAKKYCNDTDMRGTISVRTSDGITEKIIDVPSDITYPAKYDLSFTPESDSICIAKVRTATGLKAKLIVSNMPADQITIPDQDAIIYGGLEKIRKMVAEIQLKNSGSLAPANAVTKRAEVNIQGTQIIVLAIDGLRQDVLYGNPSYTDAAGCGESCAMSSADLNDGGIKEVLAGYGKPVDKQRYVMLPDVTAIFPSITLASWASIFTGKLPGKAIDGSGNIIPNSQGTGITGNEFFARDADANSMRVPYPFNNPPGMITFDSGAFKGFDQYNKVFSPRLIDNSFIIPSRLSWKTVITPAEIEATPQNSKTILKADAKTIFESLTKDNDYKKVQDYFTKNGGDPVVVAYSHYARGARWLTWGNIPGGLSESTILDSESWTRFNDYLDGNYMKGLPGFKKRNIVPFSALTVWYIPGLDHQAHSEGMSAYKNYFKYTTDYYIKNFITKLKNMNEFNNKIFIIVADHGHTAMPENLTFQMKEKVIDAFTGNVIKTVYSRPVDTSCKYKLDFKDSDDPDQSNAVKASELNNNNLHIWELGNLFSSLGTLKNASVRINYKLLVPKEIEAAFQKIPEERRPTSDKAKAHIITALNGPMAHVYSLIGNDQKTIEEMAESFRVMISGDHSDEANWFGFSNKYSYIKYQNDTVGRLWQAIDKILIRVAGGEYRVFNGIGTATSGLDSLPEPDYVRASLRINGLNDLNRSGDIVLIMKDKMTEIPDKRYTCGVGCKSWHGSLNPSDSYVPLIVAYPGGSKSTIETLLKRDEVCKNDYSNCKGNWSLPDIVKGIIAEQYK